MDDLLIALQAVCTQLVPILGAVALVFLCIALNKLGTLLVTLTETVKRLDPTIDKVDMSIEKIQAPLDTVVRLSHSVDSVQEKTAEKVKQAGEFISENKDNIKNFVTEKIKRTPKEDDAVE